MESRFSKQLITGDAEIKGDTLDDFMKKTKIDKCGKSYAVVAIMGSQSTGKSTLLNKLFGTNFAEMNSELERKQTTKGIWMSKAVEVEPPTIVLDVEGTDGIERGEDDTTFEKQSALFALAVSDVLMINIPRLSIGLNNASNKPLLKLVFRVMLDLFSNRKATLLFVIRDKTKVRRIPYATMKLKGFMN